MVFIRQYIGGSLFSVFPNLNEIVLASENNKKGTDFEMSSYHGQMKKKKRFEIFF